MVESIFYKLIDFLLLLSNRFLVPSFSGLILNFLPDFGFKATHFIRAKEHLILVGFGPYLFLELLPVFHFVNFLALELLGVVIMGHIA